MSLFTKIFGTYSQRQLRKLRSLADRIDALGDTYRAMTDAELRAVTPALKSRLSEGESLDDILPDAFAAIREADDRVLGKRPFRVQVLGGIVLHQGRIAEMKTGEGKTLVATLPAYLNALTGEGVHIVTVNEYLARVGAEEMGRVYEFMGLTTGLVLADLTPEEKQAAYAADITYGTNNEFGFDYLRDNMKVYKSQLYQRGHVFAIVDEVDSILIDEARTPLIISGPGEKATDLYKRTNDLVRSMRKHIVKEMDHKADQDKIDADYIVHEKENHAFLTSQGTKKAEEFFKIDNLNDAENATLLHHVQQAIVAHGCKHCDVDYVVDEQNGVIIVDPFTGRLMPGRRYSDGLHQAIEAKEGVEVEKENQTLATITFQNYFRMYRKLSGMTGTALTEESEFREIYNLDVVEIPTNMPMIRKDHNDEISFTVQKKYDAIVKQIEACHEKGQPVLVGTVSIDKSELLSAMLKKKGIPHNVLNAKYHEYEAEIVAQAGKLGAVTIATNMAGRGTDILLGGNPEFMARAEMRAMQFSEEEILASTGFAETEDDAILEARRTFRSLVEKYKAQIADEAERVRSLGGLFILGTERHESRRIDNQLRGRAGRQGDPGESRFYLSFEDDLLRLHGGEAFRRLSRMASSISGAETVSTDIRLVSGVVETAQKRIEELNFNHRKYVLAYDDVLNQQRSVIYRQRRDVLDGQDVSETVKKMIVSVIEHGVAAYMHGESYEDWDLDGLRSHFMGVLTSEEDFRFDDAELRRVSAEQITEALCERAMKIYAEKEALFGEENFREMERTILLVSVDSAWREHSDVMDELKDTVGLQSYAQKNPITEYRIQGAELFDAMVEEIRLKTARGILLVQPKQEKPKRVQTLVPTAAGFRGRSKGKRVRVPGAGRSKGKGSLRKQREYRGDPVVKEKTPERNDPCPCGSGKKYKNCCMRLRSNEGAEN